ncbi:sensor histidine kinase [Pontibacter pamirensis]|uniref:sensor histidine kinase n=1 Tax=Pontibacter pamirensis TaxID=2562824 RepID=UPI0013897038|nr:histidine kinase [Pontibacter pamirensis]
MLRRISIAAATAVLLFYTVIFIQMGTIWFFEMKALKELVMFFFFLVFTFWTHEKVAAYFNSNQVVRLSPHAKALLEGGAVIIISIIYSVLFVFIPQYVFIPTVEFTPQGVRLNLVVTSIISLFFYYFVERERGKTQLQEESLRAEQLQKENFKAQLDSLKNQIDPHFLFNSLNVLGSLIYKDPDKAVQFLGQLSKVYRIVLDSNRKLVVPLHTELELVHAYIFLMKTRFGNNLRFEVDESLGKMHYELPPTSVQMLIENAIKHNGFTTQEPLTIKIYLENEMLVVANNLQPRLEEESSSKVGLQNIMNRYKHFTDEQVEISPTEKEYIVRLPLLKGEEA